MALAIGSVHVDVVPSAADFVSKMTKDILGDADKLGKELGERIGKQAGEAASKRVSEGVEKGVDDADTEGSAGKKGKSAGGAFAKTFQAEVRQAIESLPDIDLDANTEGVLAEIGRIRKELGELNSKNIGVSLSGEGAMEDARRLREQLQSLRDQEIDVDVRYDIDQASKALTQLEQKIAQQTGGTFDKTLRDNLNSAIQSLPQIELDVDTDPAQAALESIRQELTQFSDLASVDLNIDGEAALADVERLSAQLRALVDDDSVDIKVRVDAAAALARLEAISKAAAGVEREVEVRVEVQGNFADTLKSAVDNALRSLPDQVIEIDVDTDPGQAGLAVLRGEIEALGNLKVGVDIDAAGAIAEAARLQAALQILVDDESLDIRVRLDAAAAVAGLAAVEAKAQSLNKEIEEVSREAGVFARTFRAQFTAAVSNLPEIDVTVDTAPALARLAQLRASMVEFGDLEIDVNLDANDALEGTAALIGQLQVLADTTTNIRVKTDALAAIADLEKIRALATQDIEVAVTPNEGEFVAKLRALVESVSKTLPEVRVGANTDAAAAEINELQARLVRLSARINVDLDAGQTLAELSTIEAALKAIDLETVTVEVKADVQSALAQLQAFRTAMEQAGSAGEASFSRMRLIIAAVLALFPLIAAAIVALPGAFALLVTPIAAVAAGVDGIKLAFAELQPALEAIKKQVSETFQNGLAPAVDNIARLVPTLTTGLVGTASAMSQVANEVTRVSTSSANLTTMASSFQLINAIIVSLAPSISTLMANIITLTNIGAQGMTALGAQMQVVGDRWTDVITSLQNSGVGVAAVESLFQVLTSLLSLLAPLTELGATLMTTFGPVLSGAIEVISAALGVLNNVLGLVPQPIQAVIVALTAFRILLLTFGATLPSAGVQVTALGLAFISLPASIAAAAAAVRGFITALAGFLFNPITLAVAALTLGLMALSSAQAQAGQAAAAHQSAVSGLASELQKTNGAVTAGTREYIVQSDAFKTVAAGAKDVGVSLATITDAATGNKTALESTRTALEAQIEAHKSLGLTLDVTKDGLSVVGYTLDEQGMKAQAALDALNELDATYTDAVQHNKDLAAALSESGVSLVAGVAQGTALKDAIKALGEASTTTTDKVSALKAAMDALNGGAITAEQAAANLQASIDEIGTAFDEAKKAATETHAALVTTSGAIDTTTEAGRGLFDATMGIRDSMMEAATTAFDAAGGLANVEGASAAAAAQVQASRDAFIAAATAAGIGAKEAENLANRYGLIPALVTTLLKAEGLPQVQQELSQLSSVINSQIPGTKTITVQALSQEAISVLDSLGIKVETLPDGQILVHINDQTGPAINGVIAWIASQQGRVPVTGDVAPLQSDVNATIAALQARKAQLPVTATMEREEIDDQITTLQSTQVKLPVVTDNTQVPAGAAAAASTVTGTQAPLPITPDGAAVPPAAAGLRSDVAGTPALLPITAQDVGATGLINALRSNVAQVVNMPITAADQGVSALIGQLRASITQPNLMPITAADQGVSALIGQLRASITQPNLMPIGAQDNASAVIGQLRASIAQPNSMPINITDGATGPINAIRTLAGTQVLMPFGITDNATTPINNIKTQAAAPVSFTVNANTDAAQAAIDRLKTPTSSTHTVTIVTVGQLPNAMGNIVPAGFSFFAGGGVHPGQLSPMDAGYARIVGPNTFRVIGDRSDVPELYLPLNQSARSKSLLKQGAARMGYGVYPLRAMALGGLLDGQRLDDPSLLPQMTGAFEPTGSASTVTSGSQLGGKGVEQRLDQLINVMANQRPAPPITVEDRSGNPIETARATQLALRLAR